MKKKRSKGEAKLGLVFCVYPDQYEVFDTRINKPICIKKIEGGIEVGSMVYQEVDQITFKNKSLLYFPPNNVGILLSISAGFLKEAKMIFVNKIDPGKFDHSLENVDGDRKEYLIEKSKIVCDFIQNVQIGIVFSYTALEAFCNLSIPEDYKYRTEIKNKGIIEVYDKKAIERWVPLQKKLCKILPQIYQTKKLENQKFWSYYVKLEKYRDDIIHQKSIERTEFYKNYFRRDIFDVCESGKQIIEFFYQQHSDKNKTNPLWPWLINRRKDFPLTTDFKSENCEVVGNLYQGIKR